MVGKLIRWLIVLPLLGLVLYIGYPFLLKAIGRYLVTENPLQRADAIAVLSGDGGVVRTLEAVRLYQDGYAPRIILTQPVLPKGYEALQRLGIKVPEERDIQLMILERMRVPRSAVLQVAERVNSTLSEMVHLTRFLNHHRVHSVLLVTSKSHSTRARKILAGITRGRIVIISRPSRYDTFDSEGWWRSRGDAKEVLAEYEKLINHWVQSAVSNVTGWLRGRDRSAAKAEATS
jgi:uncharacterized SAM-binding protein YcdF (DUF218 family)